MANINAVGTWIAPRAHRVEWANLTSADTALPASEVNLNYKTVQVTGTFDGGTVTIQGSNDNGVTWSTLSDDINGNPLTFTSAGIEKIAENPGLIRPTTTAGTVSIIMVSTDA